ncbi:hypothetical protein ARC78_15020 [Stenotrophomonas pictorum JCM 9942]|uniref:Uncharacterized protein n=1 Tax=Stenotrophomonas pictorum JCM 9942 TaxID=1236960 RepID=A0A0R0ACB3_9GAMM|nr:hypothetical protein [Stenotrophomonas pictorum]KRG39127.1 hypothetical protein ARC78_15020 [Stenotrophomonas pictorum JCM 9942]
MTDDMQRARELAETLDALADDTRGHALNGEQHDHLREAAAAMRAAPEGWSFQRQEDGSIIVTADGYGVVHVRPDDSDSIAAAMLHLLANDLAARPQGVE